LKIFEGIKDIDIINPVVTIGIFDGVHRGHQKIISRIKEIAAQINGQSVVITLWPPPRAIFKKDKEVIHFLTGKSEKIALLENFGVDNLIILPFSREYASTPYRKFVEDVLVKNIGVRNVVVGYNHAFGRNREGNFQKLLELSNEFNFIAERLQPEIIEGERLSSTLIRELVEKGEIETAGKYLGYEYFLAGKVIDGKKYGKKIGFPTANILPDNSDKLIPANGVYAAFAEVNGLTYKGMLNIGTRPTISDQDHSRSIEIHLLNFEENIYNQEIKIRFIKRIRDEKKFESVDKLVAQIQRDKITVQNVLLSRK
jgi:riboflavin kinase / FMN adenylyltransferase